MHHEYNKYRKRKWVYIEATDTDGYTVSREITQDFDLTPGLVAHYLLNNNADDCYGTFDGTPIGGMDFKGDVASFDGSDDYILFKHQSLSYYNRSKEFLIFFTCFST